MKHNNISKLTILSCLFLGTIANAQNFYTCVPKDDCFSKKFLYEKFKITKEEINNSIFWRTIFVNQREGKLGRGVYKVIVRSADGGHSGRTQTGGDGGGGGCAGSRGSWAGGGGKGGGYIVNYQYGSAGGGGGAGSGGGGGGGAGAYFRVKSDLENIEISLKGGDGASSVAGSGAYGCAGGKAGNNGNKGKGGPSACSAGGGWGNRGGAGADGKDGVGGAGGDAGSLMSNGETSNPGDGYVKIYKYIG